MKNLLKTIQFLSYSVMMSFILVHHLSIQSYAETTSTSPHITVCSTNCDFTTIQAAIAAPETEAGTIITLIDPIHTEAGIVINKDVTIQGQEGGDRPIIQAHPEVESAKNRVFLVERDAHVVFRNIVIQHGYATFRLEPSSGGAICNYGNVLLENCIIQHNTATDGGAIYNKGTMTFKNCTLRNNTANAAHPDAGLRCGAGGAIKSVSGTLNLINCTVSNNNAAENGGGIFVACETTVTIVNSTISGNKSAENGGGIHVRGLLILNNVTITQNTAMSLGGGICIHGKVEFSNTIIANNASKDCHLVTAHAYKGVGTIITNTHNLIADQSCASDYFGDPKLGPLADNGGLTQTHALLPDSPAIDVLPAANCEITTDQRGEPRPIIKTSADTPCDLGAFELQ